MTGDNRGDSPPGSLSLWKIAVGIMVAGVAGLLVLIVARLIMPPQWQFSIEAETQAAELKFRPEGEIRWQIDGATLCTRADLEIPARYLEGNTASCGSRAWRAWRLSVPEQVLVLEGAVQAFMEMLPDGRFALSLRAPEGRDAGRLSVSSLPHEPALGAAVNVIWPSSAGDRTFPYSGATTIGRAVTWSDARLLQAGNVVVYTGDESADRRTDVASAELMLGDQVRLEAPDAGGIWPKGFVRVAAGTGSMQVVAFGRADSLRIERFGESGYDFRPGWIARLASDPLITFWASVLIGYMTLILSLHPFVQETETVGQPLSRRHRLLRFFMKPRPPSGSAP